MADIGSTKTKILETIETTLASGLGIGTVAAAVRDLAEAYAWITSPSQSHGGGTKTD